MRTLLTIARCSMVAMASITHTPLTPQATLTLRQLLTRRLVQRRAHRLERMCRARVVAVVSFGGAMAGAGIGSAFGGVGAVAGGVLGGVAGLFG
jgi:uncharacterized protein (DUF2384 family)